MNQPYKLKLAVFLLRLVSSTWRIETAGSVPEKPCVIAFWHGLMLPVWKFFSGKDVTGVVSSSKDGEILSALLTKWGYSLIRGSSSKGGKEALELACLAAEKTYLLITPDGPTGPIYEFKAGAAVAAFRAQVPLCLCGVRIKRAKIFSKSWDKFRLPLPFAKIILDFAETILIPEKTSREAIDLIIAEAGNKLRELSLSNSQ